MRQLALFDPPIDPGLLVRAAAAGVDLGSVIASLNAPPPHYRFRFLLDRATAAGRGDPQLRRDDAAACSSATTPKGSPSLRASNETALLDAVRDIRKKQVRQVEEELAELSLQREHVDMQMQHLNTQLTQLMNPQEEARAEVAAPRPRSSSGVAEGVDLVAKVMHAIPEFQTGAAGGFSSPFVDAAARRPDVRRHRRGVRGQLRRRDEQARDRGRHGRRTGRVPAPARRVAARARAAHQGEGAGRQAHRRDAAQAGDHLGRAAPPRPRGRERAQGRRPTCATSTPTNSSTAGCSASSRRCTSRPTRWRSTPRSRPSARSASSAATSRRRSSSSRTGTASRRGCSPASGCCSTCGGWSRRTSKAIGARSRSRGTSRCARTSRWRCSSCWRRAAARST